MSEHKTARAIGWTKLLDVAYSEKGSLGEDEVIIGVLETSADTKERSLSHDDTGRAEEYLPDPLSFINHGGDGREGVVQETLS